MEIEATGLNHEVWQSPSTIENRLSSDGEKSKIHPPAAAVWIGALVLAIYLSLLPFVERTWRATGDEPHYLLAAHSLATDLDFDLANNYEQLDFLNFYSSKDITPQIRLSPGGQQILDHQLGLPVIIAPAYAFAGRFGVLVFQAVLGSLLAALTFKLALLVSKDETASLLATLFVTLSPPLLMYNYLVYPELPGALLTTLVLYYAVSQSRATPAAFVLTLFSLVTLPWLNRRFMPMTILLALLLVWAWRREEAWMVGGLESWKLGRLTAKPRLLASSALLILAAAVFSVALLLWFDSRFTKVGELDITVPATAFILWERVTRGLVGWLVDQQRGLFIYAPIYIVALWGWPFLVSDSLRQRNRYWFAGLPFLLSLGVTMIAGGFWIAWELGPRFLVVALPALAPMLALAWRNYAGRKVWSGLVLLLFGLSLSNTLVILQNPELPYKSSLPLYYGQKLGFSFNKWLPDLAGYEQILPTAAPDPTAAQVIDENGEMIWLAEPGSPVSIVRSGPLPNLAFGHYRLNWQLRTESGLPPATELIRLSLKTSGGGQVFNQVITAADLPADGSYGRVQYTLFNPTVDRWRTPLVLTATSSGQGRIWAKGILFTPDPFYGWLLPYLVLALLLAAGLFVWYRRRTEPAFHDVLQQRSKPWLIPGGIGWGLALVLPVAVFGYVSYQHQQTGRTYEASQLNHFVGQPVSDPQAAAGRAWLVDPQVDPPQKAIYGPFDIYDSGRYQVTFRLKLPEVVESDQDLARLQVAATANYDELITQPLRREHFSKSNVYHDFVLTIANPRRQALSFEVYYLGVAPLLIDRVTIVRVADSG